MPILDGYFSIVEAAEVQEFSWVTMERICPEGRIPSRKMHKIIHS